MTTLRSGLATSRYTVPAIVGVVALVLYLRTLMPGMAFDDWGEMQTVPHVLGIPHPTGYPTYVLIAWVFELIPIGSIAFRANLLSAVCISLALATVTMTQQRLGVRPVIAGIAALATGATGTIWASALVAEVNPMHVLFIALILDRGVAWEASRRPRDLALGGLLIGLSLGNHVLTAFVAPFVALYVLWAGRAVLLEHRRWLLIPIATLVAGLSVYAYLPIAASFHPPLPYNDPVTWNRFVFLVTGEQFRGQYGALFSLSDVGPFLGSLPDLWNLAAQRATVVMPLLGLAGLAVLVWRRPAFGMASWGILLMGIYVWASYLRLEHYLLVPWLVLGIGVGVALDAGAGVLARLLSATGAGPRPARLAGGTAMTVAGVLLAAVLVATNLPGVDRSGDHTAETYVDTVFAALPRNAAILSYWGASTPLWHATMVERRRPDVLVVDDTNIVYEGWGTRENRIASLICTRPVFIIRLGEQDLVPTRRDYRLTQVATVTVSWGGPTGTSEQPLYRVDPLTPCP